MNQKKCSVSHSWTNSFSYLTAVLFQIVCKLKISYFLSLVRKSLCHGILFNSSSSHSTKNGSLKTVWCFGSFRWFPAAGSTKFSSLSRPKRKIILCTVLQENIHKFYLFFVVALEFFIAPWSSFVCFHVANFSHRLASWDGFWDGFDSFCQFYDGTAAEKRKNFYVILGCVIEYLNIALRASRKGW